MKKYRYTRIASVIMLSTLMCTNNYTNNCTNKPIKNIEKVETKAAKPLTEWQIFTLALSEVESEYNKDAVGRTGDVGILQITPVFVADANRISKSDKFSLSDRHNIAKSIEMFNIINHQYNKSNNVDRAITLHNSKAPSSYRFKIKQKMSRIAKYEAIRLKLIQTNK